MLFFVKVWVLLSALLVAAGWLLSACHQLNRLGYLMFFLLSAFAIWRVGPPLLPDAESRRRADQKLRKRFMRAAPRLFLALAALSFFAGVLYPALNWDANAYRLPRLLHWLGSQQWHWIHTADARMNIAGCNFEWLAAPLILFNHTDRLLFLINWAPYLLLPGLIFSVFTRCQVRPQVAWWWMWLLSAGWCFAFQAGSVANDSLGGIYALAAVDFALRARAERSLTNFWWSLLAISLATGIKQTNLPLVLIWLAAAWPCRPLLVKRKPATAAVAAAAILISVAPTCWLNWQHCGAWLPVDNPGVLAIGKFKLNPFWGIVGNAFCLPLQNLVPPLFHWFPPYYGALVLEWNMRMAQFVQTPFGSHFACFESFGFLSAEREHGVSETNAGIGLAIFLLLAASCVLAGIFRSRAPRLAADHSVRFLRLAAWLALLVFMAKVGSYENARQLSPYYPFLFLALLAARGQEVVVRCRPWRWLGVATMCLAAFLVITLPARPLFPAHWMFRQLLERFPNSRVLPLEARQYLHSNLGNLQVRRECLQQAVPKGASVIAFFPPINNSDEPALWLPFGQRRVELVVPGDTPEMVLAKGVRCLVVHSMAVQPAGVTVDQWLAQYHATLVAQFSMYGEFVTGPPPANFMGYYIAVVN